MPSKTEAAAPPHDSRAKGGPLQEIVRPWVGKLHHSRELTDDWGWLRDESGECIIIVRLPRDAWNDEVMSKHRRNGTDPTQARVDAILAVLNGPNTD